MLRRKNPLECGYRVLPFFFFIVFTFNSVAVLFNGSKVLGFAGLSIFNTGIVSVFIGLLAAALSQFALIPWLRKWVERKEGDSEKGTVKVSENLSVVTMESKMPPSSVASSVADLTSVTSSQRPIMDSSKTFHSRHQPFVLTPKGFWKWLIPAKDRMEDAKTIRMFSSLQIFTACFAGFAHGANDVR